MSNKIEYLIDCLQSPFSLKIRVVPSPSPPYVYLRMSYNFCLPRFRKFDIHVFIAMSFIQRYFSLANTEELS